MQQTFKPGLIRSEQTWTLDGPTLAGPDGRTLDLREVTAVSFADMPTGKGGFWSCTLSLTTPGGKAKLIANDTLGGVNRVACLFMSQAVLDELGRHKPELTVGDGGLRWVSSFFGLLGVIALGIAAYLVYQIFTDDRMGGPIWILAAFPAFVGVILVWSAWPTKPVDQTVPAVADRLKQRLATGQMI